MRGKYFFERLQRELPYWLEQGWVTPGGDRAILEHVAAQGRGGHHVAYAFAILGVLLFGSGVITFFAANWGLIPKLAKLAVLFGAMWTAYGLAGYALRTAALPYLGQAMLLLGVILFGANIALVAQIYHIDADFAGGVLLWSLGALLAAWLIPSQPALLAAIVLGWLWSRLGGAPAFMPRSDVDWPFLLLWLAFLPPIYRHSWKPALHLALIALLLWCAGVAADFIGEGTVLYLLQILFLLFVALLLLGMVMATLPRLAPFALAVQRYGLFAALLSAYGLSFPNLQEGIYVWRGDSLRQAASAEWLAWTLAAVALVVLLALWHRRRSLAGGRPAYLDWGQGLIAAIMALLMANLFLGGQHGGLVAVGFNLLYFAGLLWLIHAGMQQDDRFLVNLAFVYFGLTLVTRYFDTFWTLLDRSYFFMLGGVLLIGGGYFIERQRRRITARIAGHQHGEDQP